MENNDVDPQPGSKVEQKRIPKEWIPLVTALIGGIATIIAAYIGFLAVRPAVATPTPSATATIPAVVVVSSTSLQVESSSAPTLTPTVKAAQQACEPMKASLKTYPAEAWGVNWYGPESLRMAYFPPVDGLVEPVYEGREPLYGMLEMEAFGHFIMVVDQDREVARRLYIDENQNLDLTDDPSYLFTKSGKWEEVDSVVLGLSPDPYGLHFYLNREWIVDGSSLNIFYYSHTLLAGCLRIGNQTLYLGIYDDDVNGIYPSSEDDLVIDRNGDKDFDDEYEDNDMIRDAFEWDGSCYQVNFTDNVGYEINLTEVKKGKVFGQVTNATTGNPVPDVRLSLYEIDIEPVTDFQGRYELWVCPGHFYGLESNHPGYISMNGADFDISENDQTEYNLVLEAKPAETPKGEVTLVAGQSYHFLKGEIGGGSIGAFSIDVIDRRMVFDCPMSSQNGLVDLGDIGQVKLNEVQIPRDGYQQRNVPAIRGHTYVARAQDGEEGHYIVFYVVDVVGDRVTLQYLYR